ncbi:MAG: CoA-binding protein [Vicinamibacterales bacterium]|nr:CoA-binding protein [Vicinamibacterales bacterium]
MARVPENIAAFLAGRTIAVAGVSRDRNQPANHIYRKLRDAGYHAVAVNPAASVVDNIAAVPDLHAIGAPVDGVVIVTPPEAGVPIVRACAELGIRRVWFHRSIGQGSVSPEAVAEARALGLDCIVGGCPMMYCEPVDVVHRCMRWLLRSPGRA